MSTFFKMNEDGPRIMVAISIIFVINKIGLIIYSFYYHCIMIRNIIIIIHIIINLISLYFVHDLCYYYIITIKHFILLYYLDCSYDQIIFFFLYC